MEYKIVEHYNTWWWGCTITIIIGEGFGTVDVQFDDNFPSVAFIKGLSVIESERKKGLGKELIDQCVILALRENKQFLQLSFIKENDWLVRWYKRLGFITYMTDEHELTMLKVL